MRNLKGNVVVLLLALCGLVASATAFYFYQKAQSPNPPPSPNSNLAPSANPNNEKPNPNSAPTPADGTANWRTYNLGERLSFRYPPDYDVKQSMEGTVNVGKPKDLNAPPLTSNAFIFVDARLTGPHKDFTQAVENGRKGFSSYKETQVARGIKLDGVLGPGYGQGVRAVITYFNYKGSAITAEYGYGSIDPKLYDQILSTFKFLDQ